MTGGANTGGIDAMNILKPYLSHNFRCIISTTANESLSLKKDIAFSRRFRFLELHPLNSQLNREIIISKFGENETTIEYLHTLPEKNKELFEMIDDLDFLLSKKLFALFSEPTTVDMAVEKMSDELTPELKYEYINKKIENEKDIISLIADCDFCIVSIDTPRRKIKMIANNACLKASVPYISGSSTLDAICIGPLVIPGKTKDLSHIKEDIAIADDYFTEAFDNSFISTLIDPYNALAASYAALECVKYITNFSEPTLKNKIMIVNLNNYETIMAEI